MILMLLALLLSLPVQAQSPWGAPPPETPPPPVVTPVPASSPWGGTQAPTPAPVLTPAPVEVPELADPGDAHLSAALVVRVSDRDAAARQLIAAAQALGGWFSALSEDAVHLKVPRAEARTLVEQARQLGDVVDRSFARQDLTAELEELQARLVARQKVLDRYLEVLATASPKAIVTVEREITGLVAEIEGLEGRIRMLEHQSRYADVSVSFQFRQRRAPLRDGRSSFRWINTLNVADVLDDFESGRRARRSASDPVAPGGFAPYRRRCRFQAVSPDDVVYRVRSEKHKPQASLDFWREAMRERMTAAGYTLLSEGPTVSADGVPGILMELGAASGEEDLTYLLAVFDDGNRLVIAEAAGEATRFRARRDAIVQAINNIDL